MKQFLNMESLRITSILVLLYTCSVSSFPSRPLNERSADLAWQAWLLVDDQNQEKNYGAEALGRRRITPKSVFIAPTFSPESLPPCASGYQSDSMGRCVKLIEIDQEAHLDFLLQKLNERFGYEEYSREEDDEKTPPGPVQLNIPLDETPTEGDSELEKFEENVGVAIVVTPTNGRFSMDSENENDDIKKNRKKSGEEFNDMKNVRNSNHEDLIIKSENFPFIPDAIKSTTTPLKASTDSEDSTDRTTIHERTASAGLDAEGTTTESLSTETETTNGQQALFFREPEETEDSESNSDNTESTAINAAKNSDQFIDLLIMRTTTESLSTNTESSIQKRTTVQYQETDTDLPELHRHHNFRHDPDHIINEFQTSTNPPQIPIRFPLTDIDITTKRNFEDSHDQNNPKHNLQMYANRFQHLPTTQKYIKPGEPVDVENTPGSEFVFKSRDPLADENFRRNLGIEPEYDRFQIKTEEHSSFPSKTRRNIDTKKTNTWFFASTDLTNSSPHKPLVFRFPRKNGSRRLLSETIQQPQKTIYREISPEDLKVLFGNHRHKRKSDT